MIRNIAVGVGTFGLVMLGGCPQETPTGETGIGAEFVAGGLTAPVAMAVPLDGTGRIFIVSQPGDVVILDGAGGFKTPPFLSIRERITPLNGFDERGLLGLAFHPRYGDNGRFFVFYTAAPSVSGFSCDIRISEFKVTAGNADAADAASERVLLDVPHPQNNHCGGQLAFGPDGYLYFSIGDGGGAGDNGPGHTPIIGNGQDKSTLLGKIGRIDVDGGTPYAIPADNPFAGDSAARPEIWALGLRNAWKFSIDDRVGGTARMLAADVGQAQREEVSIITRGGNYGWRIREGTTCFNVAAANSPLADCAGVALDGTPLTPPIIEYAREDGISIIGGYVYRGSAVPSLRGKYIFGDLGSFLLASGKLFVATEAEDGSWSFADLLLDDRDDGRIGRFIYSFGRDADGEVYILTNATTSPNGAGGEVFKIVAVATE